MKYSNPRLLGRLAHGCVERGEAEAFARGKIDVSRIVSRKIVSHGGGRGIANDRQGRRRLLNVDVQMRQGVEKSALVGPGDAPATVGNGQTVGNLARP